MTRQDIRMPDHGTGGFGVSYVSDQGILLTISVYDSRLGLPPNGVHSSMACAHFIQLKSQLCSLVNAVGNEYGQLEPLGDEMVSVGRPPHQLEVLCARFRLSIAQHPALTYIFLTVLGHQFFRIRCTYPQSLKTTGQQIVATFLDAMAELLGVSQDLRNLKAQTDHGNRTGPGSATVNAIKRIVCLELGVPMTALRVTQPLDSPSIQADEVDVVMILERIRHVMGVKLDRAAWTSVIDLPPGADHPSAHVVTIDMLSRAVEASGMTAQD